MPQRTQEFIRLLGGCERQLFAFLVAAIGDVSSADDVMQETRLKLWEQFDRFQPGTDFASWAFTVARYEILAHRRQRLRERNTFSDSFVDQLMDHFAHPDVAHSERSQALAECLQRLPVHQRQLIMRRYQPGCSISILADEVGKTVNALHQSLWRIRRALHRCVNQKLGLGEP
jgi:RNA polymerase sigma-70 factor, ECF subfamily